MILIGEAINIVSKSIGEAIRNKEPRPIQEIAIAQEEAGADMLDVNIGPARKAPEEMMSWIVKVIEEVTSIPLSLDTTNPIAMEAGLRAIKKERPLINSASAQKERLEAMLPLAKKYDVPVIGLLLTDEGIPSGVEERANVALEILNRAIELGIRTEDVWIDPILFSVVVDQAQVVNCVEFFKLLPDLIPNVGSTCGLSNVSNGAPKELRSILNRAMYCILAPLRLHSAILDVLDKELMMTIRGIEKQGIEGFLSSLPDKERKDMEKTMKVLRNESIYCHSWLEV